MKSKDIILLFAEIFVLVVAWIIFTIYHNAATSTISEPLDINIQPIDPNFDTQTITELKKREKILPLYELGGPTPTQSPELPASQSTTLTP